MNLLEITKLTMRFGGLTAVNALDLQMPANEIVSVIGPNGAGKTTVFNAITGIYEPTAGRILFNGRETRREFRAKAALMLAFVGLVTAVFLTLAGNIESLWETGVAANSQCPQVFPCVKATEADEQYFAEHPATDRKS